MHCLIISLLIYISAGAGEKQLLNKLIYSGKGMKYAHNMEMRVFCKQGDDELSIVNTIHELFPFDFDKEKVEFTKNISETFDGKTMKIFTVFTKKETVTTRVLKDLFSKLSASQKALLRSQLESRLDDRLHFYLRLDKPKLLSGEYEITDSGDCFHFKICVAAYPHKRPVARSVVEMILKL
jgi:RNA binding exosome subunit